MRDEKNLPHLAANTIRFLAADAVQKANSGHPGMPMGMADAAVTLWTKFLKHNPSNPAWENRDRFVLSAGHGSMLLYSLLHLTGYELPMEELKSFRQWGSQTPGHPEYGHAPGVETTTGPLGQGISNAVGFAIAERWLAEQFNAPDYSIVDHYTYVIASDGDLEEGVSHEVGSLAGHLGLGKLIVLYDDNGISIDGPTELSFSEDVSKRFEAYGWHAQQIDGHDMAAVEAAITAAQNETERPSIIACRTTIGYGSPNRAGTAKAHGEPLGEDEVVASKKNLGWPEDAKFLVPDDVYAFMGAREAGEAAQKAWQELFEAYRTEHPDKATRFEQMLRGELPAGWDEELPAFELNLKMATRAASGKVLAALVPKIPLLLGGSADLTGSNKTDVKGTGHLSRESFDGRYIYYGVREHGMGAIMNGIALHGGVIPYGGTFLVFSDYMRPAVRLAALTGVHVIYVYTHDSIGLGEDGPTHQPIEHLMALRAIPNLWVIRPAEANETAVAWKIALRRTAGPSALVLTRQGIPTLDPAITRNADKGAYVVADADKPQVILMATGSEVSIAVDAQRRLSEQGIAARVVSMPCWELFEEQPAEYKESVLPADIPARVSIEAGATLGWERYVGPQGVILGLDHFGASAPYDRIYQEFGLTAERMAEEAKQLVSGGEGN